MLTRLAGGRPGARTTSESITLAVRDREFQVRLETDLPDDAYQQLFLIDLTLAPAGELTWDHQARGWRFG